MPKTELPFVAHDISALAKSLGRELQEGHDRPGHVQLLNMLARGAGYRNFQHFRSQRMAEARLDRPPVPPSIDHRRVEQTARLFDTEGRMIRWPTRLSQQSLCLWALWARLPKATSMSEAEMNARLNAAHSFGDPAILRRILFGMGLVTRKRDGSDYRRVERAPPPEAAALIRHLAKRLA